MKCYDPLVDYYNILGVPAEASAQGIQYAYRNKSKILHPDKNPPDKVDWATEKMAELNNAYDTLKDETAR